MQPLTDADLDELARLSAGALQALHALQDTDASPEAYQAALDRHRRADAEFRSALGWHGHALVKHALDANANLAEMARSLNLMDDALALFRQEGQANSCLREAAGKALDELSNAWLTADGQEMVMDNGEYARACAILREVAGPR